MTRFVRWTKRSSSPGISMNPNPFKSRIVILRPLPFLALVLTSSPLGDMSPILFGLSKYNYNWRAVWIDHLILGYDIESSDSADERLHPIEV